MSGDGRVIVGDSYIVDGVEAFKWDNVLGLVGIGQLDAVQSTAYAANFDGSVIVGSAYVQAGAIHAFRWDASAGMVSLGSLNEVGSSTALAVNSNGDVVAGFTTNADGFNEAFRWDKKSGMVGLGDLPGGYFDSNAAGISADGKIIVGVGTPESGTSEAFSWDKVNGMVGLGDLDGGLFRSSASAISADGRVIVGFGTDNDGVQAVRWDGMVIRNLGDLDGGIVQSIALAANHDGSIIVGRGDTDSGDEAFYWTESEGMQSLQEMLADMGIDMAGRHLSEATSISHSGLTIAGHGYGDYVEAFLVRLGDEPIYTTPGRLVESAKGLRALPEWGSAQLAGLLDAHGNMARASCASGTGAICAFTLGSASGDALGGGGLAFSLADDLLLGASLGYGAVKLALAEGGEIDLSAPSATLFGAFRPEHGLQLSGVVAATHIAAETARGYMNGNDIAYSSGSTTGVGLGGDVRLGWALPAGPATITPSVQYQALQSGYSDWLEEGGPLPASVSNMGSIDHIIRVGAEARASIGALDLWVAASLAHRLDDATDSYTVSIVEMADIGVAELSGPANWGEIAAGFQVPMWSGADVTGGVSVAFGPSTTSRWHLGASQSF